MKKSWRSANIADIGPTKPTFMTGWHSIRHNLGIEAFGINGITKNEVGDEIIKAHNELNSKQQEFFYVAKGEVLFKIGNDQIKAVTGTCIAIEPEEMRSAVVSKAPATLLIVGAKVGEAYSPPKWDTIL